MNNIVIYGPPGCGKTHNASVLMVFYGMDRIIDEFRFPRSAEDVSRCLLLTETPEIRGLDATDRIIPFADAMKELLTWKSIETMEHPSLSHGGPTRLEFHTGWLYDLIGQIKPSYFKVPRYGWRVLCLPFRTRMANAETFTFGPFSLSYARPWLISSARALHPEIFE